MYLSPLRKMVSFLSTLVLTLSALAQQPAQSPYTPQSQDLFAQRSPEKILELNRWLKDYCEASSPTGRSNGCLYLDYFSAMANEKGLLKRDLAEDGLHPNVAGYKIMAPLAEAAIGKALAGKP